MTNYVKAKHNVDAFLKMQDGNEDRMKQNKKRMKQGNYRKTRIGSYPIFIYFALQFSEKMSVHKVNALPIKEFDSSWGLENCPNKQKAKPIQVCLACEFDLTIAAWYNCVKN